MPAGRQAGKESEREGKGKAGRMGRRGTERCRAMERAVAVAVVVVEEEGGGWVRRVRYCTRAQVGPLSGAGRATSALRAARAHPTIA